MKYMKKMILSMISISIFGMAVIFPDYYQLKSLAMAYAWVLIVTAWILSVFIIAVAAVGVSSSDDDLKEKSKQALRGVAESHEKTPSWLKWLRLITTTSLIALAAMPVTAVIWAISGLSLRAITSIIASKYDDAD